jgi:hypothetical protein
MSKPKIPAALTKNNIGEVVEMRVWTQYQESRAIEENSEKFYVGRLESFAHHNNGIVISLSGGLHGITVRYDYGEHVEVNV